MPDGDEIELPRYSRHVGVVRGPVADQVNPGVGGSIGVLGLFAGVLNGPAETDRGPSPAFSYLTLGPSVVERLLERETVTVRTEDSDRPESAGELRVRHLLWGDPRTSETDRTTSRGAREPVEETTVLDIAAPGEVTAGDRTGTPDDAIRNVTVLGSRELTVLDRVDTMAPLAVDRSVDPTPNRTGSPPSEQSRTVRNTPISGEEPALSTTTVTNVTDTTVRRASPVRPASRSDSTPRRVEAESERSTRAPSERGSRDTSDHGDDADLAVRTASPSRERPPSVGGPELTVVSARPAETGETRRPGTEGERTNGTAPGDGRALDGDRPAVRPRREASVSPRATTTMTALLEDTTEMNRLVDRLYREFQRKERIERERRGL